MTEAFPDTRLTIDLDAIVANWRALARRAAPAACAAVVKADAYGLGAVPVATALAAAGCTTFFVAHVGEGVELRAALPDTAIVVLHGLSEGAEALYRQNRLVPALGSLDQIERWRLGGGGRAVINIDTGMNRLGLAASDIERLHAEPARLAGIEIMLVMSHLACAEERDHPKNPAQLALFRHLRTLLPAAPASLANSAGIYLGQDYTFDLVRPGIGLYGVDPLPDNAPHGPGGMTQVVHLKARILQVRDVDTPMTVGYGATHRVGGPGRIATVPVGYADGFLRGFSSNADAWLDTYRVPLVGRVSMDLITLDVSAVPRDLALPGAWVTVLGGAASLREAANRAGTIEYELLTRLGRRFVRHYVGGKQ